MTTTAITPRLDSLPPVDAARSNVRRNRTRAPISNLTQLARGVIVPQLTLSDAAEKGLSSVLTLPWTFVPLDLDQLPEGTILYLDPKCKYADGSMEATFAHDHQLIAFETKHRIKFNLHLSKEFPINLPPEACRAAGIPAGSTAFQFIYPAALTVTFKIPSEDTPAARSRLAAAIKEELRPYMQHLLLIGGYIYHQGNWMQDAEGSYRDLAGINVLDPNFDVTGQNTQLYFSQAKIVPDTMHRQLAAWAQQADRFFSKQKNITDFPAMSKITVGPLAERGLTHFKWLEPRHELILKMQTDLNDPNFGKFGVFVYYSTQNPQLSCMLPVATRQEWKECMRKSTYLKIDQPDGSPPIEAFTADECQIQAAQHCEQTAEKLIRLQPCKHMQICLPCWEKWKQDSRSAKCPTCRTIATSFDRPNVTEAMLYRPHTDLGSFNLNLAPFAPAAWERFPLLSSLVGKNEFRSPILPISLRLKQALSTHLPDGVEKCAFIYPIYGKSSDLTFPYIGEVKTEIEKGGDQATLLQGLVANGGFAFFDANNALLSVHSIVQTGQVDQTIPLPFTTGNIPPNQGVISREIAKLKDTQQDEYGACRITLQNLLPYAKYFGFVGSDGDNQLESFQYSRGGEAGNWQATLTI